MTSRPASADSGLSTPPPPTAEASVATPRAPGEPPPGPSGPRRRGLAILARPKWGTLIVGVGLLGVIQVASTFFPPYIFPDVPRIFRALGSIFERDGADIGHTLFRFAAALGTAILVGWVLGLLMGAFRKSLGAVLSPTMNILMAMPALSWILVSVLWISSIEARTIFICFVIGMPFFAVAVYEGIRDIDSDMVKAVRQFRPTRLQVIRFLFIPQSLVFLLLSIRSTSALCLRILVFAEMIGATSGIGERMSTALANFRMDLIFAWTIVMILGNFLLLGGLGRAERWLLRWRDEVVM